jgi:hypothetical protein
MLPDIQRGSVNPDHTTAIPEFDAFDELYLSIAAENKIKELFYVAERTQAPGRGNRFSHALDAGAITGGIHEKQGIALSPDGMLACIFKVVTCTEFAQIRGFHEKTLCMFLFLVPRVAGAGHAERLDLFRRVFVFEIAANFLCPFKLPYIVRGFGKRKSGGKMIRLGLSELRFNFVADFYPLCVCHLRHKSFLHIKIQPPVLIGYVRLTVFYICIFGVFRDNISQHTD